MTDRDIKPGNATTPAALTCPHCLDAILLVGSPERRADDERWFRARHPDREHGPPPSMETARRKR
jgi:hypothetical protein